jgi:hypothetical protein
MVAHSATRVVSNTNPAVNNQINRRAERNVEYYASHPDKIESRLRELDEEWDIERVLETGSSALTLTGLLLSIVRGRKWLLLSLGVQSFFMQHALQGWCPPLPMFRRLGFRTRREIDEERYALKTLRGDFRNCSTAQDALRAVRL